MTTTALRNDPSHSGVRVTVFGGMHLYEGEAEVDIGPPRQRAILAMLLAARGETVTISQLTDALWAGDAPASAANQIQRHVGNLRRVIEPRLAPRALGSFLIPSGSGYVLRAGEIDSDLARFFESLELSRTAGRAAERQESAVQALTLAAAPAFAELPAELLSSPVFGSIRKDRSSVCPIVVDAVRAGTARPEEVLPVIERMAQDDPLD